MNIEEELYQLRLKIIELENEIRKLQLQINPPVYLNLIPDNSYGIPY